ncbi:MAG: PID-CTERM protein-sorting domain-containing protein [Sphingobacteriaceae bacterium]
MPVDGGISVLLGAGLAYGAARLRKKKEDSDLFI